MDRKKVQTTQVRVDGRPKELSALASFVVDEIEALVATRSTSPSLLFGPVVSLENGPPKTLTITLNGSDIPNIRYIGADPSVSDRVAVLVIGNRYLCLGVLA